jgi:RHS repeat-associated protein
MKCRIENGVTYTHTYNAENRASSIAKRSGDCATGTIIESWSFAYDGDGTRVTTAHFTGLSGTPDSVTSYFMGGQYEVKDGATKKYYSIAGMMVAVNDGTGLQYLLTDHLGSTVAVTNASGTLTSQQRYLPFGEARTIPNSPILATDFGYTGQRLLDSGMGGIMDYKARFYSPYLNRFLQPDSIIPNPSNPQNWNRYSYVGNNPVLYNDPTGHDSACGSSYSDPDCNKLIPLKKTNPPPGGDGGVSCSEDDDACWMTGRKSGNANRGGNQGGGVKLDFSGYSSWEIQILKRLYENGGADGIHSVEYILANNIHIKIGDPFAVKTHPNGLVYPSGDWQTLGDVSGWYESGYIVLNPDKNSYNSIPGNWTLSIIAHEAWHMEQGHLLAKTKQGELEGYQVGLRVYMSLAGITFDQLPAYQQDLYNSTSGWDYGQKWKQYDQQFGTRYWWGLRLLPPYSSP